MCVCVCVCVCVWGCGFGCVFIYTWLCVFVCISAWLRVHFYVFVCELRCGCLCDSVRVHMCVRVCVCVCLSVCLSLKPGQHLTFSQWVSISRQLWPASPIRLMPGCGPVRQTLCSHLTFLLLNVFSFEERPTVCVRMWCGPYSPRGHLASWLMEQNAGSRILFHQPANVYNQDGRQVKKANREETNWWGK